MRTAEVKVYKFDELSDAAKQRARDIEKDKDCFDSWDIEHLMYDYMSEYDIESLDISFSLSHCQGDGVSFTGILWDDAIKRFVKDVVGSVEVYNRACEEVIPHMTVKFIRRSHRYSNPMTVYTEIDLPEWVYEEVDFADALVKVLEPQIENWRIGMCNDLEKLGYEQIEYYRSDEYVDEMLRINEYEFTEDGKLFTL